MDHRQIKAYAVDLYTSTRHSLRSSGDGTAAITAVAFEISYNDSWDLKYSFFLDPLDSPIACVKLSIASERDTLNQPFRDLL